MSYSTPYELYFVKLVNQTRKDLGLDALKVELSLNDAADGHSAWMLAADRFSHSGRDGSTPTERIREAGLDLSNGWSTAENIAYVSITGDNGLRDEIRTLHQMLLDSPGHYANIVDADSTLIGIGLKVGTFTSGGRDYKVLMATQNFADTGGDVSLQRDVFPEARMPRMNADLTSYNEWRADFDGRLLGATGPGRIEGSGRNDEFRLGGRDDDARGRDGSDWMVGRGGDDTLRGDSGDDMLRGYAGQDRLLGGNGGDTLIGDGGADMLVGSGGNDLVLGGNGHDMIFGGSGRDSLEGNNGHDRLTGETGRDFLRGGGGNDRLVGGDHADTLVGGQGDDQLIGGSGADCFVFSDGFGEDTVQGFQPGNDRLFFEDMLPASNVSAFIGAHLTETSDGVVLDFGDGDSILFLGRDLDVDDVADSLFTV